MTLPATAREPDLLRLTTAGSVDDGKSTLIGRLLHDAGAIYDDQLEALRKARGGKGDIDLSLVTDGLRAEREQGITIDVAYRYFDAQATIHHRRHAGPRSIHAEHGDGRVHRRPGRGPHRRATRHPDAVALRIHRVAARRAARGRRGEQDGSRGLRPGRVRAHPRRVQRVRRAGCAGPRSVHPDERPRRRQRRHPRRSHAVVRGPAASSAPRVGVHRGRRQLRRLPAFPCSAWSASDQDGGYARVRWCRASRVRATRWVVLPSDGARASSASSTWTLIARSRSRPRP